MIPFNNMVEVAPLEGSVIHKFEIVKTPVKTIPEVVIRIQFII